MDDKAEYRKAYICYFGDEWTSIEQHRGLSDARRDSGYKIDGKRCCAQTITFTQEEDRCQMVTEDSLTDRFALKADSLIRKACAVQMPDALKEAIANHTRYDGEIGSANADFTFEGANTQDWTVPPTVRFTLRLTWKADLNVEGSNTHESEV